MTEKSFCESRREQSSGKNIRIEKKNHNSEDGTRIKPKAEQSDTYQQLLEAYNSKTILFCINLS